MATPSAVDTYIGRAGRVVAASHVVGRQTFGGVGGERVCTVEGQDALLGCGATVGGHRSRRGPRGGKQERSGNEHFGLLLILEVKTAT